MLPAIGKLRAIATGCSTRVVRAAVLLLLGLATSAAFASPAGALTLNASNVASSVPAGQVAEYDIRVANDSLTTTSAPTQLTLSIPAGTTFEGATGTITGCTPTPAAGGSTVTCTVPALGTFGSGSDIATLRPQIRTSVPGTITLSVTLGAVTRTVTTTVTSATSANLGVDLVADVASVPAGGMVTYTATVSNAGPDPSGSTLLTVDLTPISNALPVSTPPGCTQVSGQLKYQCSIAGPIANGGSRSFDFRFQATTPSSQITAQASLTGSSVPDPVPGNDTDTVVTTVDPGSDLGITKTLTPNGLLVIGMDVSFTLETSYTGSSPTGVRVTDSVPPQYSVKLPIVAPGWSCSVSGQLVTCDKASGTGDGRNVSLGNIRIDASVTGSGQATNTASIAPTSALPDGNPDNDTASDRGPIIQNPQFDIKALKTGPTNMLPGAIGTFEISTRNNNSGTLSTVSYFGTISMTDTLPAGFTFVRYVATNGWSCPPGPTGGQIVCTRSYTSTAPFAAGVETPPVRMELQAPADFSGSVNNTMTVGFDNTLYNDPETGNNTATVNIGAALPSNAVNTAVYKTALLNPVRAGEVQTYRIEVVNTGPATATNVELSDDLRSLINTNASGANAGVAGVTVTGNAATGASCSTVITSGMEPFSRRLLCTIGSLPVCARGVDCPVVEVGVRLGGGSPTVTNTANVAANDNAELDLLDNSSTVTFDLVGQGNMTVTKAVSPSNPAVGQRLTYSIKVINQSTTRTPANNVQIVDELPLGVIFRSATPGAGTCTSQTPSGSVVVAGQNRITCELLNIEPGNALARNVTVLVDTTVNNAGKQITNSVSITRPGIEGDIPDDNTATATVTAQGPPVDLALNKTGSANVVLTGDTETFTISVANLGSLTANNVVVTDTLPQADKMQLVSASTSGGSCTAGSGTLTCTYAQIPRLEERLITVVMRAVAAADDLSNRATVTSTETLAGLDPIDNNTDEVFLSVRARTDMEVVSKLPSQPTVSVGEAFSFDILVRNNPGPGRLAADDVQLTDAMAAGMELTGPPSAVLVSGSTTTLACSGAAGDRSFTCDLGTVSLGAELRITVPARITAITSLPQSFDNTATVSTSSFDEVDNNAKTGTVSVAAAAALAGTVFKDFNGNGQQGPGDPGVGGITIALTGTSFGGPVTATTTTAADGSYSFSLLPPGTYSVTRGAVSIDGFSNGIARPGSAGGTADSATVISQVVLSSAPATGYDFTLVPVTSLIGITKALASGPVAQADGSFDVSFLLAVNNPNVEDLANVVVTDVLQGPAPQFGTFATEAKLPGTYSITGPPTGSCGGLRADYNGAGRPLAASGFTLAAGTTCTVTIALRVMPTDPPPPVVSGGNYLNSGSVTGEGALSGQTVSATSNEVPVLVPTFTAAIGLVKSQGAYTDVSGDGLTPGDTLTYGFTVTNTGNLTLTAVTVTDPKVANIVCVQTSLTPGQTTSCVGDPYVLTQDDISAGTVDNTATAQGTPATGSPVTATSSATTRLPLLSRLGIEKVMSQHTDTDGNGVVSAGDTLAYTITATNLGNTTLTDVVVTDTRIAPDAITCASVAPGGTCVLEGSLTVTTADAQAGQVVNTAVADSTETLETGRVTATVTTPVVAAPTGYTLSKTALVSTVKRGEKVPYVIVAEKVPFAPARIVDVMPPGFAFVAGSAVANGRKVVPAVDGRNLTFEGLLPDDGGAITLELTLVATASVKPGTAVNQAQLVDPGTGQVVATARARVTILAEALFDCGDIIGKVFDDQNRNGYQDDGEPGLAAVRVATVGGLLITTDAHGRFNIPCADIPDAAIGSNFIVKLDTRTLPTGYHVTTENPRRVRLTAGKAVKLNFGASISRLVRLELNGKVFEQGSEALKPKWAAGLDKLIAALAAQSSVLEITYRGEGALAKARLRSVKREITQRWAAVPGHYDLPIETRLVSGAAP